MTWTVYIAGRPVTSGPAADDPEQVAVDALGSYAAAAGTHPRQLVAAWAEVTSGGGVLALADARDW